MLKIRFAALCLLFSLGLARAQSTNTFPFATMNCYWFFSGDENRGKGDLPKNEAELDQKAGHLIGLLPEEAPLFLALEEIGGERDLQKLARAAKARYQREYAPIFIEGNDTSTGQNVGALLDTSRGWGVSGEPVRVSELQRQIAKHLVVRLTNELARVDVCVVHLRVPSGEQAAEKQVDQNRALLRWTMRHLANDPKANIIVMGDFNEAHPAGSPEQSLAVLFQSRPPMVDPFDQLKEKAVTHGQGRALDRILISEGISKGESKLRFADVEIRKHSHARGDERRLYTDHYPVVIKLDQTTEPAPKKKKRRKKS